MSEQEQAEQTAAGLQEDQMQEDRKIANAQWVMGRSEAELKFMIKIKYDIDALFQNYIDAISCSIDIANKILGK